MLIFQAPSLEFLGCNMLDLKIEKDIATITMNRPEVHNAFNDEMIDLFLEAQKEIRNNIAVRLVILKAEGKSFCAGADLNWMKKMVDYSIEENVQDSLKLAALFEGFENLDSPIIGLIHGSAMGGGVGLVSICDYALASEGAKFGFTEARLGLAPCVISPYVLKKIGESEARAWFYSGERFDAQRAYEMKLVHEVISAENFELRAKQVVQSFMKAGPKAGVKGKMFFKKLLMTEPAKQKQFTAQSIADFRVSAEAQEGMKALLEKRKPTWSES